MKLFVAAHVLRMRFKQQVPTLLGAALGLAELFPLLMRLPPMTSHEPWPTALRRVAWKRRRRSDDVLHSTTSLYTQSVQLVCFGATMVLYFSSLPRHL